MEILLSFLGGLVLAALLGWFILRRVQTNAHTEREAQAKQQEDVYSKLLEQQKTNQEAQFKAQMDLLKEQFANTANMILQERSKDLKGENATNVTSLLEPIRKELEEVRKSVGDSSKTNAESNATLQGVISQMISQTTQISTDANNLTQALKNKGKVHGDWGEQLLTNILTDSGLREGEEFFTQASYRGENGNELRPDVVVKLAEGKNIIVDSKVSLTDYTNACGAVTEEERAEYVKKNFESVKKHVKELAAKNYPNYVENSLQYVLMFIPNEGAYVMAMNHDSSLMQEAFDKGVIIVNPTNLMMVLHLVLLTWRQTRQEDNCKKIINSANAMYEKVVGLVDTLRKLEDQLNTVGKTMETAHTQMEGKGGLQSRVEALKEYGITSTKKPKTRSLHTDDSLPEAESIE